MSGDARTMGEATRDFLTELYEREFAPLRREAHSAAGDRAHTIDPSGAAVEALIRAAVHRDQFRGGTPEEFRAWVRRILVNQVLDALRLAESNRRAAGGAAADRPAPGPGPAETAERADDSAALFRAIDRLPEADREVLLLAHRSDVPQALCEDLLGISGEAYRKRVSRARARLREEMDRRP